MYAAMLRRAHRAVVVCHPQPGRLLRDEGGRGGARWQLHRAAAPRGCTERVPRGSRGGAQLHGARLHTRAMSATPAAPATRFGFADATHAPLTAPHAAAGVIVASDAATPGAVFKGASDTRAYRALTLGNGLRAVLISDPAADKAAAACAVAVGHLADPPGLAGCSHAVEHLLFLGTTKYPAEDGYKAFLKAHGGGSNASTGAEVGMRACVRACVRARTPPAE